MTMTVQAQSAQPQPALPQPTGDVAQALADIAEFGVAIIPDVLSGQVLRDTREAMYRAARSDRQRGREEVITLDYADDTANQRVANMLSRDPLFEDLACHPIAVELVKAVLGWPALLGNISANITGPGGGAGRLHADQMFVPEPWSANPQGLNVAWCIDDFTQDNGATRVVPRSHLLNRVPQEGDAETPSVAVCAPAGSIVVFESRLWHQTGFNHTTDQTRAGVFAWYTRSIYRTQENWFLSLKPEIRQYAAEDMLVLLGYKTAGLGMMNGASPA